MPLTNDIELNGVQYNVVPGAYKKGLRKAQAVSRPAARRIGKAIFGPFEHGVLQAADEDDERGWASLTVGPVFDGAGIEPFPNSATHADGVLVAAPTTTLRAYGCVAGTRAYVGIGQRIYKSVLLTAGAWGNFTLAADLGAGVTITGLTYFLDDVLIMSAANDIRKINTVTDTVTIWRSGEKGQKGVAYAGQLIYAPNLANNQEELRLSLTKWNGNAVTAKRYLDSPIINMANYNGKVVIATRKSLYVMGGQPFPGEPKDPDITNDTGKPAEWIGDPEPVMGHGVFAEGDDFTFLESYRGRLYTWLGGRVAEFDAAGEGNWLRIGPEGVRCYGAAVAGDWLIVAIESRYGAYEAWGFDGAGWWLLHQRAAAPAIVWPVALAGAGTRDALLFRDGSLTYDLLRLRWRSSALNTYAGSGEWVSSLIDGDDPTADKAWRRIGATFAAPGDRGNTASVDSVSFPLEYSIDGGLTWVTVEDTPAASGATRVLTRGHDYGSTAPTSRCLQLRQKWSSVSDWAPVLTSAWVEFENAEEYALGEAAQAAYEVGIAAEDLLRRRWELTIDAGDGRVTRAGGKDAKTGRQAIAALWDAWELGTTVTFKDIDHDTDPVAYVVSIVGMEEKAAKPSDSARWGESTVTLLLEESAPGVAAGPPDWSLGDLDDVTLATLADGQVLMYDQATGQWVNETIAAAHDPVTVSDTATVDLSLAGQALSAAVLPGGISHAALANLGVGDPHPQYALDTDLTAGLAGKSNTGHTHDAGDVTSGQFAIARLASGAPDGTKFIRDDGVLATPAGGGGSPLVYVSTVVEQFVNTAALSDFTNRYTIPANNAAVGKVYRLTARGLMINNAGGARTYTFAVRLGGVTVATVTAISVAAGNTRGWEVGADLIVVSTGAGGQAELQGVVSGNRGTVLELENAARVVFDTTAAKTFGIAVTMSAAAATVACEQRQITVEALV